MAAIRCKTCRAVITARLDQGELETTLGASYREECRSLPAPDATGPVASVCPEMERAIRKAMFRLTREAAAAEAARRGAAASAPV